MSEEEVAQQMSRQYGVPYASFENKILQSEGGPEFKGLVPKDFARKRLVLPMFVDEDVLAIAVADPGDKSLLGDMKQITGYEIQPFVAAPTQILEALEMLYDGVRPERRFPPSPERPVEENDPGEFREAAHKILRSSISRRFEGVRFTRLKEPGRFRIDFLAGGEVVEQTESSTPSFDEVVSYFRRLARLRDPAERAQQGAFMIKLRARGAKEGTGRRVKIEVFDDPSAAENQLVLRYFRE